MGIGIAQRRVGRALAAAAVASALALGAACTPTPTPTGPVTPSILMVANQAKGFFSLPWPNDIRKTGDGHLNLSNLPGVNLTPVGGNPIPDVPLLPIAVQNASKAVTDFGTNTAVYLQATVALDHTSVPTPAQSTDPSAPLLLVDLDASNAPAPFVADVREQGDDFRPDHTIALLPYPGHPLAPGHRYAAIAFDSLRAATGAALQPAPLIAQLDQPWSSSRWRVGRGADVLRAQRDAVRAAAADLGRDPADVVVFTVYRTQAVGADMAALAATVRSLPQPTLDITAESPCAVDARAGNTQTSRLDGTISMPSFQAGQFPYLFSGGNLVIDPVTHTGVVQRMRPVKFSARIPCGTPPAAGWPIAAFIDGTGGDQDIDTSRPPFDRAGWLVGEIAPGMANTTDPTLDLLGLDPEQQVELLFYNVLNPPAGRGNSVQQAADHLMLLRALEGLTLPAGTLGSPVTITTNDAIQLISGQSQGAATLPLVADNDPDVTAVLSAAGGGGLYHSVAHGYERRSLFALLTGNIAAMDELNPLQQLLQTVVEETDGSNYRSSTAHFLNLSGVADACVSIESAWHLDQALGLTILNRQAPATLYGEPSLEPATASLPYTPPAGQPLRVDLETNGTHWSGYDAATATLRNGFVAAIRDGQTPTVPAGSYLVAPRNPDSCAGRWDAPTNTFGR